ncbi:MAG: hypothetical protein MK179_22030 [Pirellulaceae bacterium]|nr:hypothetical protein [Pirellulaceae bacterium]
MSTHTFNRTQFSEGIIGRTDGGTLYPRGDPTREADDMTSNRRDAPTMHVR